MACDALTAHDAVAFSDPEIFTDPVMVKPLPDTNKLPDITALPLYGNVVPLPPFKAYDAVKAYDALNAGLVLVNIEPVTYDAVPCSEPVNERDVTEPLTLISPPIILLYVTSLLDELYCSTPSVPLAFLIGAT